MTIYMNDFWLYAQFQTKYSLLWEDLVISSQLFLWLSKNSPKHAQNAHIFLTGVNATMKIVLTISNSRATQDPFIYFHTTKSKVCLGLWRLPQVKMPQGRSKYKPVLVLVPIPDIPLERLPLSHNGWSVQHMSRDPTSSARLLLPLSKNSPVSNLIWGQQLGTAPLLSVARYCMMWNVSGVKTDISFCIYKMLRSSCGIWVEDCA